MSEPTEEKPKRAGEVRLSTSIPPELYARLLTIKGRTRKSITDLCAQWIEEGVARMEAELAKS